MFERFTDRARRVFTNSSEEARRLHHSYIGTEHLLLGLMSDEQSLAAQALESLGVTLEKGRESIEEIIGEGGYDKSDNHLPFTPRAKKVMELSLQEALSLGGKGIHPEHILLGIIREGEGVACQSLVKMGVDPQRLKARLLELITDARLPPQTEEESAEKNRTFDELGTYPTTEHAYRVLRYALEMAQQQSSPLEVRHLEIALRNA